MHPAGASRRFPVCVCVMGGIFFHILASFLSMQQAFFHAGCLLKLCRRGLLPPAEMDGRWGWSEVGSPGGGGRPSLCPSACPWADAYSRNDSEHYEEHAHTHCGFGWHDVLVETWHNQYGMTTRDALQAGRSGQENDIMSGTMKSVVDFSSLVFIYWINVCTCWYIFCYKLRTWTALVHISTKASSFTWKLNFSHLTKSNMAISLLFFYRSILQQLVWSPSSWDKDGQRATSPDSLKPHLGHLACNL